MALWGLTVPRKCWTFRMGNTSLVEYREIRIETNVNVASELSAFRCRETRMSRMFILNMENLVSDDIAR